MAQAGDILGRYTLVRRIAGGGMGEVFLADVKDRAPGAPAQVAIKLVYPEHAQKSSFIQMMIDEAKITSRLGHPNIVSVTEFSEHQGTYFMVMEHVAGTTVHRLVEHASEAGSTLSLSLSLHVASEVLRALQHAHDCKDEAGRPLKIVHRDVTPGNVIVSAAGEVKLVDFGIARATGRLTRTQTGNVKGKLGFFAPEMLRQEPFDGRADVFALGVTLYSMLAGRHPTEDDPVMDGISRFEHKRLDPPSAYNPRISPELDGLVMRSLEPQPEERWQSAEVFREALDALTFAGRETRRPRLAQSLAELVGLVAPELKLLPKPEPSYPDFEEATTGTLTRSAARTSEFDVTDTIDDEATVGSTRSAARPDLVAPSISALDAFDSVETGDIARPPDPSETSPAWEERTSAWPGASSSRPHEEEKTTSHGQRLQPASRPDISEVVARFRRLLPRSGAWLGVSLGLVLLVSTAGVALRLRSAKLTIATIPPGASIAVNNVAYTRPTPLTVDVAPGVVHAVALSLEGHQRVRVNLGPLEAGDRETFTVPFLRLIPMVHIDPVPARVFVNDREVATSTVVSLGVLDGAAPVDLRVEAPGFKAYVRRWPLGTMVPEWVVVHLDLEE